MVVAGVSPVKKHLRGKPLYLSEPLGMPNLVYDKNKIEDLDTNSEDHSADALRYGIMSRPKSAESLIQRNSRGIIMQQRNKQSFYSPYSP